MKVSVAAIFSLVVGLVSAKAPMKVEMNDIAADSALGMKLLSKARKLGDDADYVNTWIAGFSLKFEGCHHISQWNSDANGDEDVRIATKRLVRFRLCPTDYCSASSSKGCTEGYGDYIIDMNTYLAAYFEAKQTYQQFVCENLEANVCGCGDNNNRRLADNNQYSEEMCLWDCYAAHNMGGICMENNPYGDQESQNQNFQLENYMACAQADLKNNNNNARALNDQNNQNAYYIGPYCASQGGAIYLGVFTDDSCTTFADSSGGKETYYYATGTNLPYGNANIIDIDCLSCKEPQENNNGGNDNEDGDDVAEVCESIYTAAGKCESSLPYGTVYSPNNNACNYMEGIKIVRKDGTVITREAKANKTASVFIGVFVVAFVLLSAYVYYLKTKLDRASINLSE